MPTFATDRLSRSKENRKPVKDLERPLVTVTAQYGGKQIAAVNAAANMQGIKPGLSLADAQAQFPDLTVKQADPLADLKALNKLAQACERYTPWIAIDSLSCLLSNMSNSSGLWLDITGCAHFYAGKAHSSLHTSSLMGLDKSDEKYKGELELAKDLHNRCTQAGYHPRIGLADTNGAAWAAARFSEAPICIIPPKAQRKKIGAYPIEALRLDPATLEGVRSLGLRDIHDLYDVPRAPLFSRFGEQVLRRLDQMLGRMEEPISPRRPGPVHYVRMTFAEPVGRTEDISLALNKLLAKLCPNLETNSLGARRLELSIFRVDNSWARLKVSTSQASRDQSHLLRLFRNSLDTLDPGFGIEIIILAATKTNALIARQIDISGKTAHQANENAAKLVDRLSERLGMNNVILLHPVESHLPERATKMVPALETLLSDTNWLPPNHRLQRPIQLLQQPFPIEVIAPVPDGPPVIFLWRRQQYKIIHSEGPERISPEWWRPTQLQTRSRPLTQETRDYYRLEDQNGQRYWVYREGLYRPDRKPGWYIHGFFA